MSSHNFYEPNWHYYQQNHIGRNHQSAGQGKVRVQNSSTGTQEQGGMPDLGNHGQGNAQDPFYFPYSPMQTYNGPVDMQHMFQMLLNLGNQLDHLNRLIAQNNHLLQSMNNQEDTKYVQGGSGTVIVRM
ncbi:hypothetical protein WQ54_14110 [Bacillus sp. SA1-12]|uniref:hypothetical protein n=1 Tax=Bacillus sp. SA1-12 TaxID=1455638 RepID=UPI0006253FB1|nr:hypothetical protein [Bacillus sp. SA1-12]KKI91528.1 hypothetical protein WQ54_14110 [Bacillus sp. SA1-12]